MKLTKQAIIFLVIFISITALCVFLTSTKIHTSNYITNYESIIDIDTSGNIHVEETVVMKYSSYDNYFIRGIRLTKEIDEKIIKDETELRNVSVMCFRGDLINDADYAKDITDDVDIVYSFTGKNSYETEGGTEYLYSGDNIEYICIDAINAGHLDGTMTYIYKYDIYNMATIYNDCAELYYKLFDGQEMDYDIKYSKVSVGLPKAVNSDSLYCFSHGVKSIYKEVAYNSVTFYAQDTDEGTTFGIRTLFPKETLTENESNKVNKDVLSKYLDIENRLVDKLNKQEVFKKIARILTYVIIGVMVIITIVIYVKYDKEIIVKDCGRITTPPYDYNPALVGYLVHGKSVSDNDLIATLLDLIRKGYIKCESVDDNNEDFVLTKQEDSSYELTKYERCVYSYFLETIGDGNSVSTVDIKNYGKTEAEAETYTKILSEFKNDVIEDATNYEFYYDQKVLKTKLMFFLLIPIAFIMFLVIGKILFASKMIMNALVIIGISIAYAVYILTFKKRTEEGSIHYNKWMAYKKYLEEEKSVKDMNMDKMDYFESLLCYATSLQVSKRIMKELKVEAKTFSNGGSSYFSIYPVLFYSYNDFHHNYSTTISSSSSSSSGGGGFSGGGGGGGFSGGR